MSVSDRYAVRGAGGEFEPGSRGRVLRNALGIRRVRDMQLAESQALQVAQQEAIRIYSVDHRFTAGDICKLHRLWLGPIYAWAGSYRDVNMIKDDFPFADVQRIPALMTELEQNALRRCTPCRFESAHAIAAALAKVHAELVLIHPFREGNGRIARMLAMLMALQAGLPPLIFTPLDGSARRRYIAGIHAAMERDYRPLTARFVKVIERTWKSVASSAR
jgi:cell filamentation protein